MLAITEMFCNFVTELIKLVMQSYKKERQLQNNCHLYVKDGERPRIKCLFTCLQVGTYLHIKYDAKLHNAIKQEAFRQNEIARAIGGELNIKYRTKRVGDEILILRLS